jgi:hypothetical protein
MATKKNDKKWIQGAIKRPGAFTAKAKRRKMTVAQFAAAVRKNPSRYDATTRRQANLAVTLRKISKNKKKKK